MIYIFYVQSHIAFYLSLSIREYYNIDPKNVRYITVRNYKNQYHELNELDFSNYYNILLKPEGLKIDDSLKIFKEIDDSIQKLVNNSDYCFVTHSLYAPFWQCIATNPLCKDVMIMEDGTVSYFEKKELYYQPFKFRDFLKFFKKLFSAKHNEYYKRAPGFAHYSTKGLFNDVKYFSIFKEAFPFIPNKQKIVFNGIYKDNKFKTDLNINDKVYLIFDAVVVEKNLMHEDDFLLFLKNSLEEKVDKNTEIYYRFHPLQRKSFQEKSTAYLENEWNAKLLPAFIPFEQIIVHAKNIHVIGCFSTLLFYAKRNNVNTTSLVKETQNSKVYEHAFKNFPNCYLKELFELK